MGIKGSEYLKRVFTLLTDRDQGSFKYSDPLILA